MGNIWLDPIFALFAYESGTLPDRCHVLSVGDPYIDPYINNTFRTYVPRADAGGIPDAIWHAAERLRCAADTQPPPGHPVVNWPYMPFYVLESNASLGTSEVEGFKIDFANLGPGPIWRISHSNIISEFPGTWAVDCEVVPSYTNHVTLVGETQAQYNWLCVLMRDNVDYWLAFYDPLNPTPDNPGNNPQRTIYMSNKMPISVGGFEPVAMDVDHQYFEVYVLCRDPTDNYAMTVFEFFY